MGLQLPFHEHFLTECSRNCSKVYFQGTSSIQTSCGGGTMSFRLICCCAPELQEDLLLAKVPTSCLPAVSIAAVPLDEVAVC